jgi:hypothetical protein
MPALPAPERGQGRRASELLHLPVRLHGIELGRPVDALVDLEDDRLIGFELLCGDEARRFLPFAVARVRDAEIEIDSALTLIDERDLDFYLRRSRRLSELALVDALVDEHGAIHEARSAA